MQVKLFHGFDEFRKTFGTMEPSPDVAETVGAILKDVRSRGDAAVQEYTARFDGVHMEDFRVPEPQLQQALDAVDVELRNVLERAAANIRRFHERQKTDSQLDFSPDGTILGWKVTPVDSAGVYIPGWRAFYPSSLLMNVIPAQVAGVPRIAMVSPRKGRTPPRTRDGVCHSAGSERTLRSRRRPSGRCLGVWHRFTP